MNFNTVMIGTEDAPRLIEYYTRLFGTPGFEEGGMAGWQLGAGFITVMHHSEVKGRNASPGRHLLNIESDDVHADFERLTAAGAIVVREPYREDGWPENTFVATLADPDDNYFQLVTPMG